MCRSLSAKSFGVINELVGITGEETQFLVKFIYFIYLDGNWLHEKVYKMN